MNRNEWLITLPKNMVWCELGVFIGDYSKLIFDITKPSKLYLVDLFPNKMISGDKDGKNMKEENLEISYIKLKEHFKNHHNVYIIKDKTFNFLSKIENNYLDIVYIDADHSFEGVYNDLIYSYNKVKIGGFICGHDYSKQQFKGVFDAVNKFCDEKNLNISFLTDDLLPTYVIKL